MQCSNEQWAIASTLKINQYYGNIDNISLSIHSKSFLTLTINKWNTMHISDNLTWAWVLVCGRGRDRGATACHCRGPVLPSPATSPASSMSRRCPIVAWLRPAAMYLDTNPIQFTVQCVEISRYLLPSKYLRDAVPWHFTCLDISI